MRYGADADETRMTGADERRVVVDGLASGGEYTCTVKAGTGAGYGPPIARTFFTLPPSTSLFIQGFHSFMQVFHS